MSSVNGYIHPIRLCNCFFKSLVVTLLLFITKQQIIVTNLAEYGSYERSRRIIGFPKYEFFQFDASVVSRTNISMTWGDSDGLLGKLGLMY